MCWRPSCSPSLVPIYFSWGRGSTSMVLTVLYCAYQSCQKVPRPVCKDTNLFFLPLADTSNNMLPWFDSISLMCRSVVSEALPEQAWKLIPCKIAWNALGSRQAILFLGATPVVPSSFKMNHCPVYLPCCDLHACKHVTCHWAVWSCWWHEVERCAHK